MVRGKDHTRMSYPARLASHVVTVRYAPYPIFPFPIFARPALTPIVLTTTGFHLVAVDAYDNVEFDDDEAVSFASFGDFCDAVMPDTWVAATGRRRNRLCATIPSRAGSSAVVRGVSPGGEG